jgi:tetratricopeptide (TPR) repeat protein
MGFLLKAIGVRPCQPDAYLLAAEALLAMPEPQRQHAYPRAKQVIHRAQRMFRPGAECDLPLGFPPEMRTSVLAHTQIKLARFFIQAEDGPEAFKALQMALDLKPDYAAAYADLAFVHMNEGRADAASEAIQQARELAPHDLAMVEKLRGFERHMSSSASSVLS